MKIVTRWDWRCNDGEHCGWVVVEADNRDQAMLAVPSVERHKARAVKLTRFSQEDMKKMHI